jgi:prepilin-type N-terminal cleavage/methylation domain-containing protein
MNKNNHNRKGFTLIELLVVIAIIAILAVVVVLTLNPAELLRQSRDSNRVSDFATLKSALSLYIIDNTNSNLASSSFGYAACYLSTIGANATTSTNCGTFVSSHPSGNVSSTAALYRNNNSTGWLPVNFSQLSYGSPLSSLPIDPTNNASYYYAYAATTTNGYYFELDTFMESKKYNASGTNDVVSVDGGDNNLIFEAGNQPKLNL